MGGPDAIRGYLVQSLVGLLASLDDPWWDYVEFEPDDRREKADVIWSSAGRILARQYKSSRRGAFRPQVVKWAKALQSRVRATEYELQLVGDFSAAIASMRRVGKVLIPDPIPLNLPILLWAIAHRLHLFVDEEGIDASGKTLNVIGHALTGKLLLWSTDQERVSRKVFRNQIREWTALAGRPRRELRAPVKAAGGRVSPEAYFAPRLLWSKAFLARVLDRGRIPIIGSFYFVNDGDRTVSTTSLQFSVWRQGSKPIVYEACNTVDLEKFFELRGLIPNLPGFARPFELPVIGVGPPERRDILFCPPAAPPQWEPGQYIFECIASFDDGSTRVIRIEDEVTAANLVALKTQPLQLTPVLATRRS